MIETAIVALIVLATAYFSLRSIFRMATGKKSCCESVSEVCGSCSFADKEYDAAREKLNPPE